MELEDIVNEEMLTIEDVNDILEHTDKGRTKQTIRNCVTVLQKDPVLKKAIKRNELSGRMDIVKEVPWERRNNSSTVTDTDENNLKMYLEENYELTSERVIKAGVDQRLSGKSGLGRDSKNRKYASAFPGSRKE